MCLYTYIRYPIPFNQSNWISIAGQVVTKSWIILPKLLKLVFLLKNMCRISSTRSLVLSVMKISTNQLFPGNDFSLFNFLFHQSPSPSSSLEYSSFVATWLTLDWAPNRTILTLSSVLCSQWRWAFYHHS